MLVIKLWNFFKGYAIIKVEGLSIEKFINLVISKNIYIWNVERVGYTTVIGKISLNGFKLILPYTRITNCKVTIIGKRGLPFIILSLKRRKMLLIGALVCILLAYTFSFFIWSINVNTTNKINEETVMKELNKLGLKSGVAKSSVDISKIEQEFLIDVKDAAWIGIDIKGTKAFVKVVEKTTPPAILSNNVPCNIIAKKDGIIYKMNVLEGDAVKKVGDTVKMGDLIVSGVIERQNTETRLVHSMGSIVARTWYEGYSNVNLSKQEKVRTGKILTSVKLSLGSNVITLSPRKNDFQKFDKELVTLTPKDSPIKVVKEVYYETKYINKRLDKNDAEKIAIKKALDNIKQTLDKKAKIVNEKKTTKLVNNDTIMANVTVEVLEDIGVQDKINKDMEAKIERNNN